LLKLKTIAEYQQLMNGCLELFNSGCDKKRMHKTRYALLMLMLAMSTDYSFGMQANVITTVAGNESAPQRIPLHQVRPHQNIDDHRDDFSSVSLQLLVTR
jgi:hypothetical protein